MAWTERYVTTTGAGAHDGTSEANAWTLAEAIAAPYAAGQRINVKAGTYSNTTTDRTFGVSGTTTAPIWWRGYNSAIGDLDADFSTAKPLFSFTTGRMVVTGGFQRFSNLSINGAQTTNGQVRIATTTDGLHFDRCRIECTSANAAGRAVNCSSAIAIFARCWLKATSSAEVALFDTTQNVTFSGCALEAGANGIILNGTGLQFIAHGNAFLAVGGDALRLTASTRLWAISNSFSSPGSDGIEFTVAPSNAVIIGNIFAGCGGYGINNSTGGNLATIFRLFNDFYSNTSGNENGMGDTPGLSEVTESSSPFTSSSDLSMVSGANGKGVFPGLFENESFTGYGDLGAVNRQESGGGSASMMRPVSMNGGKV